MSQEQAYLEGAPDNTAPKRKTKHKPNERDKVLGARLRARRKFLKMSQKQLGEKVDITFQQIQKYERGTNKIGAIRLADFCSVLSVPIAYFYGGLTDIGEKTPPSLAVSDNPQETLDTDPMLRKETLDLVRAYYNIKDPKVRANLIKLAQSMADSE